MRLLKGHKFELPHKDKTEFGKWKELECAVKELKLIAHQNYHNLGHSVRLVKLKYKLNLTAVTGEIRGKA